MGRATRIKKQRRNDNEELRKSIWEIPIWVCPCGCGNFALFPCACSTEMATAIIAGGNRAVTELGVCMTQVWDILEQSARNVVEQSKTNRGRPYAVYPAVSG